MAGSRLEFRRIPFGRIEALLEPMSISTALDLALAESYGERWADSHESLGVLMSGLDTRNGTMVCLSLPYLGPRGYITSVVLQINYPKATAFTRRRHGWLL